MFLELIWNLTRKEVWGVGFRLKKIFGSLWWRKRFGLYLTFITPHYTYKIETIGKKMFLRKYKGAITV